MAAKDPTRRDTEVIRHLQDMLFAIQPANMASSLRFEESLVQGRWQIVSTIRTLDSRIITIQEEKADPDGE